MFDLSAVERGNCSENSCLLEILFSKKLILKFFKLIFYLCHPYSQAVDLILKPRPDDLQMDIHKACKVWSDTKDATQAVKHIKRDFSTEATVLRTLAQQGNTAYVNALQKVSF